MKYHLVVHDVPSFQQHEDWIGRKAKTVPSDFGALSRGDGIVYYCKEDIVITGTFKVASSPKIIEDDADRSGPHVRGRCLPTVLPEPSLPERHHE